MAYLPIVFISSTSEDLKEHREQAKKAALASGFHPVMMEEFTASGAMTSLPFCLEKVAQAHVVVALAAHRCGWVPDDPLNHAKKSITWLECEHAWKLKKEVLGFVVDSKYEWPATLKEEYRLVSERKTTGIAAEVEHNEETLAKFKQELGKYVRPPFTDAASVRALISEALADWLRRHANLFGAPPPGDPDRYLSLLEDDTRNIRIKGLKSKRAEPYVFGIEEIYIPLTTLAAGREMREDPQQRRTALEQALNHRKTVIIGAPGSGKSTFLRRTAFELCRNIRGTRPANTADFLPPGDRASRS